MKKIAVCVVVAFVVVIRMLAAPTAMAGEKRATVSGELTFAITENPFGVAAGDSVTLQLSWDEKIDAMEQQLSEAYGAQIQIPARMNFHLGNMEFEGEDDLIYPSGPVVMFSNDGKASG